MAKPQEIVVRVVGVKGHCPAYQAADSFRTVDGFRLVAETALRMHSSASLLPYYVALSRGISTVEFGLARGSELA